MESHVHDNIILDSQSVGHTTAIPKGVHDDLKLCLQQALEYLEIGKHEGGHVVLATINIECVLELAEAVVDYCCKQTTGGSNGAASV